MSLILAATILVTAPTTPDYRAEAAYEDMVAGRNREAIERIEASADVADGHPASLINLAIAYAREGEDERARRALKQAARLDRQMDLETAAGEWVDSRKLAQHAMAELAAGRLRDGAHFALK